MESFEHDPKEVFYETVKNGAESHVESGLLPERYAAGFLKRAERIGASIQFDGVADALQKAEEYISSGLEPAVGYFSKLNEQEMRLLALSGEIGLKTDRLGTHHLDETAQALLDKLAEERARIDADLRAIGKEREIAIDRANREISETSSDGSE